MHSAAVQSPAAVCFWSVWWSATAVPSAGRHVISGLPSTADVDATAAAELHERRQPDGSLPGLSAATAAAADARPVRRLSATTASAADEDDGPGTARRHADADRSRTTDAGATSSRTDGWDADAARRWAAYASWGRRDDAVGGRRTRSDEAVTVRLDEQYDAAVWSNAAGTVHKLWAAGPVLSTSLTIIIPDLHHGCCRVPDLSDVYCRLFIIYTFIRNSVQRTTK